MNKGLATFRGILAAEWLSQFRSGLSALYILMPLFWIIIARFVPIESRPFIVLIGAYSDPVTMGQLFTGAFVAREQDQGLIEVWATSPLGAGMWLLARVLIIGLQGSLGGIILAAGSGVDFHPLLLMPGVFLAATSGALLGLIIARPFRDILSYFVIGGLATALISLPIAGCILLPSPLWLICGPAVSGWTILARAFNLSFGLDEISSWILTGVLFCWAVFLFILTRSLYHRGFFRRAGKEVTV